MHGGQLGHAGWWTTPVTLAIGGPSDRYGAHDLIHRIGLILVTTGAVISALGLSVGFGLLFADLDRLALWVLAFVPAGFLLAFLA